MRPLRAPAGLLGSRGAEAYLFGLEWAALDSFYSAKIAAARRGRKSDVASAIRAVIEEQQGAFRALTERKCAAAAARRLRRGEARAARTEITGSRPRPTG